MSNPTAITTNLTSAFVAGQVTPTEFREDPALLEVLDAYHRAEEDPASKAQSPTRLRTGRRFAESTSLRETLREILANPSPPASEILTNARMEREGFQLIEDIPLPLSDLEVKKFLSLLTKIFPHNNFFLEDVTDLSSVVREKLAKGEIVQLKEFFRRLKSYVRDLIKHSKGMLKGERFTFYAREIFWTDGSATFHYQGSHQNHMDANYVTVVLTLEGPGTLLRYQGEDIEVPTRVPILFAGTHRKKALGSPATLHRAPKFKKGQRRLTLFLNSQ